MQRVQQIEQKVCDQGTMELILGLIDNFSKPFTKLSSLNWRMAEPSVVRLSLYR